MNSLRIFALSLLPGLTSAYAVPVPENERLPIDLRGATLIVRDIDKSWPRYRDALGINVVYEQKIGGGKDLEERFTKISKIPGVTVATPPERIDYPPPGERATGRNARLDAALHGSAGFHLAVGGGLVGDGAWPLAPRLGT